MLKEFTVLVFFMIATTIITNAQNNTANNADERAIRANVEQMMKGWNAKNGADFAKPFAEDADYVIISGRQIKGREIIAKGHQNIFETIYKDSNISMSVEMIRFLRPDVAVVHVSSTLKITQENSTRTGMAKITMVMTKTGEKWEIAAFQNTEVKPN